MTRSTRLVVVSAVVGASVAWWAATSPRSPVNPNPPRPVLNAVAKLVRTAARWGLWVALCGEEPPKPKERSDDRTRIVQAVDGLPRVDHSEGW